MLIGYNQNGRVQVPTEGSSRREKPRSVVELKFPTDQFSH